MWRQGRLHVFQMSNADGSMASGKQRDMGSWNVLVDISKW